ncbi:MAG: ATP synthase F1 subunit delta [Bacteroides sp.]|nr:ATP synthase F1 subunit delta [Bacteroides sp.]MCM1095552.1 ATP synthase F1 subunit delta [Terasakiella sp.]
MNEGLIPRRYAKALYKVGVERNCADRLYTLMGNLAGAYLADPALPRAIANPFVPAADKSALLATAAGATAEDSTFADFVKLLERNRRIDLAGEAALAYTRYYRLERGIRQVTVTSAAPLPADQLDRIRAIVKAHLHGGSMEFATATDPSLIGGFTVNIDNERLDASVERQLKELRQSLLN